MQSRAGASRAPCTPCPKRYVQVIVLGRAREGPVKLATERLFHVIQKAAMSGTDSFYNVRDLLGKVGGTAQVDIEVPQR